MSSGGLPAPGAASKAAPGGWRSVTPTEVLRPFLIIAAATALLPVVGAAVAPSRFAGPLALVLTVGPLVLGFLWRPKAALMAFAIYMLFADTFALYLPDAVSYTDEISVPLFVLIGLVRWRPITRRNISPIRDGAVAVFFLAALASTLLHAVPLNVWVPELALVAKGIAFFYLVTWIEHTAADIRAYARVIAGVAVVVLAFAALEFVAPSVIPRLGLNPPFAAREGLPSLKGPFIQPVHFGWFCAFVASLAFSWFAIARGWFSLVLGLLSSLGVIASARRWSLVSLVAAVAALILLTRAAGTSWRASIRIWGVAAVGTAILIVAFLPAIQGLVNLAFSEYVDPALQASAGDLASGEALLPRLALYRGSFEIARDDFPLGVGLGRYASFMSGVDYSPVYAEYGLDKVTGLTPESHAYVTDTFWPQIIGEAGVIGFVAYVVFLGSIGMALLRLIRVQLARSHLEPVVAAFALGAGVVFAQSVVESIANTMFHHPPEAFVTFGVLGIGVALATGRSTPAGSPTAPLPSPADPMASAQP